MILCYKYLGANWDIVEETVETWGEEHLMVKGEQVQWVGDVGWQQLSESELTLAVAC